MPDKRPNSKPKSDLPIGKSVVTPDGPGKIVGFTYRKNTNGGPGTKQYSIRLVDGRVRRYPKNAVRSDV